MKHVLTQILEATGYDWKIFVKQQRFKVYMTVVFFMINSQKELKKREIPKLSLP